MLKLLNIKNKNKLFVHRHHPDGGGHIASIEISARLGKNSMLVGYHCRSVI